MIYEQREEVINKSENNIFGISFLPKPREPSSVLTNDSLIDSLKMFLNFDKNFNSLF